MTMTTEMGDLVAAGRSAAGGPAPAGADVVVPVEAAAPPAAAAAAPPTVWTRTRVTTHVTSAGAAPAWTVLSARLALAAALFLLGCAAAGLAFFAMLLPPPGMASCMPTDGEVARLRTASGYLLLAASSQVLAATVGLLVPVWIVAFLGTVLGVLTSYHAFDVLVMLVTCHGSAHGALGSHLWLVFIMLWAAIIAGVVVSIRS